jgi:hypothetical protein
VNTNDFIILTKVTSELQIQVLTTSNVLKRKYYLVIQGQDLNFWRFTKKYATVTINYECGLIPVQYIPSVILNTQSFDYIVGDNTITLNAKSLFTTALPSLCPITLALD